MLEFGDVVLLQFPFTNQEKTKKRPALVICDSNEDVIVARITSKEHQDMWDLILLDWQKSGLKLSSTIRFHKIATLSHSLIDKKMGRLSELDMKNSKQLIQRFVENI